MSRLDRCLARALKAGNIDESFAEQLTTIRDGLKKGRPTDADFEALRRAAVDLEADQRLAALQIIRQGEALENVANHPEGISVGVTSLLARDLTGKAKFSNIDSRMHAIQQQFMGAIADAADAMRPTALGLRQNTTVARNVVRELHGTRTGDADAAEFAKALSRVFEYSRQRFNRAGGAIPKRKDFGMPQAHDEDAIRRVGRRAWKEFTRDRLDPSRMYDDAGQPLTPRELDRRLDAIWEDIILPGPRVRDLGRLGVRKTASTRQQHRHLAFRDGDAWLEYFERFGGRDVYSSIVGHLEGMAGDIAKMEVLGPNPEATFRYLRDIARRDGLRGVKLSHLDALWRIVSGQVNDVASERFANTMTDVRNFLTSAKLGSAMLSSVSDLAFIRQTARWNGLSSTRIMRQAIGLLNPANAADRKRAVKMGLVADAWTMRALAAHRFAEVTGAGVTAKMADFTMRASGLSAWTDAAQKAVGLELMTVLAEQRGKTLAQVPAPIRRLLEAGGFDEADWQILRTTQPDVHEGVEQMYLPNLSRRSGISRADKERVLTKALEIVRELTNAAVPSPDARVRTLTTGGFQRGTLSGEAVRVISQFKTFPVSVVLQHVYRGIYQGAALDRASYLASLTIATTVLGALAFQAKEISKGREPRPMDDPEFWTQAFTQGGGAGIFGDFAYAGLFGSNRFGGSLAETLGGPVAGLATDVLRVTAGQVGEVVEGEDANLGGDAAFIARRYTPTIGSLWYTRLAYERMVLDQLELQLDPNAPARFARDERRRRREYEQRYWWARGETAPEAAQ